MSQPEPGQPQPGPQPGPIWPPPPQTAYQAYPHYPQYPPHPVYAVPSPVPHPRTSSTGPASFACGLMAALLGWIPLVGIALGVLGLALAMKALRLAKLGYLSDRGLAIAGVVLSCLGLALGVLVTGTVLIALSTP